MTNIGVIQMDKMRRMVDISTRSRTSYCSFFSSVLVSVKYAENTAQP